MIIQETPSLMLRLARYWLKKWLSSLVQAFLFREIPVPSPVPSSPTGSTRRGEAGYHSTLLTFRILSLGPPILAESAASFRPTSIVPESSSSPSPVVSCWRQRWYTLGRVFLGKRITQNRILLLILARCVALDPRPSSLNLLCYKETCFVIKKKRHAKECLR